ncbi:MAG: hypothetical protein V4439_01515 [Patescibacteria group bacterium]
MNLLDNNFYSAILTLDMRGNSALSQKNKIMELLTKGQITKFDLKTNLKNFLESVEEIFSDKLNVALSKFLKQEISIESEISFNEDEDNGDYYHQVGITFIFVTKSHWVEIDFSNLDTTKPVLFLGNEDADDISFKRSIAINLSWEELFSKEIINGCVQWLTVRSAPKSFREKEKAQNPHLNS